MIVKSLECGCTWRITGGKVGRINTKIIRKCCNGTKDGEGSLAIFKRQLREKTILIVKDINEFI